MSQALRALFTVAAAFAIGVPVSAQQGQVLQVESNTMTVTSGQSATTPMTVGHSTAPTATFAAGALVPGPSLATSALSLSSRTATTEPTTVVRAPSRQNTAMMIVGGAALVLGAVIGGDEGTIIMIAGGGVGLLGLYRHLR